MSLKKHTWADDNDANEEEDFTNMVAPPDTDIAPDFARQTIAAFRSSCLVAARQCAVSGKGQSWCNSPAAGPALQACHIIPQEHYHLYPDVDTEDDDNNVEYGLRRLRTAWQRTWSADNSILLLSHLHELFDARLFSIHPDTFQVRAFVPYDVVCEYHGRKARLPVGVDRAALRHHYEMCCIENMGAKMPLMEPASVTDAAMGSSGMTSPFMSRAMALARSGLTPGQPPADGEPAQGSRVCNHSKRPRPEEDDMVSLNAQQVWDSSSSLDLSSVLGASPLQRAATLDWEAVRETTADPSGRREEQEEGSGQSREPKRRRILRSRLDILRSRFQSGVLRMKYDNTNSLDNNLDECEFWQRHVKPIIERHFLDDVN